MCGSRLCGWSPIHLSRNQSKIHVGCLRTEIHPKHETKSGEKEGIQSGANCTKNFTSCRRVHIMLCCQAPHSLHGSWPSLYAPCGPCVSGVYFMPFLKQHSAWQWGEPFSAPLCLTEGRSLHLSSIPPIGLWAGNSNPLVRLSASAFAPWALCSSTCALGESIAYDS